MTAAAAHGTAAPARPVVPERAGLARPAREQSFEPRPAPPPRGWRDALLARRDAIVASPRFQRWAASFPLTRPIALRRAQRLFDLCAGFVYSQTLLACLRIGIFDLLAERPRTMTEIAALTGMSPDAAQRLLDAACAVDLLERRSAERFGLGPVGAPIVGNGAVQAMIEHNALLYDDLRDPVALLRGDVDTRLAAYWSYTHAADDDANVARRYSTLMAQSVSLVADDAFQAVDLHRHRHLLDVGGGNGAFLAEAAARFPSLRLTLFELPGVAAAAEERFRSAALDSRACVVAGDFRVDPLPHGADIVTLVRVLHDHDDATVAALLRATHAALPANGRIVIVEPLAGLAHAERVGGAYFPMYFQAMGSGRTRTPDGYREMLAECGFRRIRLTPPRRPVQGAVITASR
jgi:demethylspheroidene O-methyltransferase